MSLLSGPDDDDEEDDDEHEYESGDEEDDDDLDGLLEEESVSEVGEEEDGSNTDDDAMDVDQGGLSVEDEDEADDDGLQTMQRFQNDLFADEGDDPEDSGEHEDTGFLLHLTHRLDVELTTHERRQAELQAQIEELEAENVGKKDWTLMGEANARSRPQNSLLEEDLDFERVAKVVPVVTEEVVQRLEDRIKARIAAGQFDDVVRQRPTDDRPFLPSRFFELQDTKSKQSLAEIYEDDYVAAKTGGIAGDDRDGKLRKEHEELVAMWDSICYKLDALSNAHFTPKQVSSLIVNRFLTSHLFFYYSRKLLYQLFPTSLRQAWSQHYRQRGR